MRLSKNILECLKQNGTKYIFGIPAGSVSPIYDSLNEVDIKPIITKNEGGAAYMAARYASVTQQLSVCVSAGGVGICNMINGIADALRIKVPMLILTGYVHRWQIGKGAIQELDTKYVLKPLTKYSEIVLDEKEVIPELEKAIKVALTPPYGPVHLCIPIDVQLCSDIDEKPFKTIQQPIINPSKEISGIKEAIGMINFEKHGIIMVGRGCRGYSENVMELSKHLQWPIITTPEGKGVIPCDFPLNLGNYGFASSDTAQEYIENGQATCVLVLGSSLGESATCNYNKAFVEGRKIIHVDWDIREYNKVFKTEIFINANLGDVIPMITKNTISKGNNIFEMPRITNTYEENQTKISLKRFFKEITGVLPNNTYYVSDIGEYMNFIFKFLEIPDGGDFEINLNHGAMGAGIAGAIGVKLAYMNRPVAVFAGDGSFLMNGNEILTAKEYNLPIIYFVINNAMLGYVKHGHKYLYGRDLNEFSQKRISISKMMDSVGIRSMELDDIKDMELIRDFVSDLDGPCVIEINTDGEETVPIVDRFKALKNN